MKAIWTMVLIVTVSFAAFGQEYERGLLGVYDLKGLTTYFIDSRTDSKNRELILKQISRARISGLSIAGSAEEAEILLVFRDKTSFMSPKLFNILRGSSRVVDMEGLVLMEGSSGKKSRLIFSYKFNEELRSSDRHPATRFGKKFVEEYKRANGLK